MIPSLTAALAARLATPAVTVATLAPDPIPALTLDLTGVLAPLGWTALVFAVASAIVIVVRQERRPRSAVRGEVPAAHVPAEDYAEAA